MAQQSINVVFKWERVSKTCNLFFLNCLEIKGFEFCFITIKINQTYSDYHEVQADSEEAELPSRATSENPPVFMTQKEKK